MEQRFPSTWAAPKGIAYQPVSTNPANREGTPGYSYNTVPDQSSSSPPLIYPDRSSMSISTPPYSSLLPPCSPKKNLKYRGIFSDGWRAGITFSAITAVVVLFINAILTIWASKKYGQEGGIGLILEGYCHDTKRASLWLHFVINTLSTVLLSASNYSMQCLSAPTRAEVDKAHARSKWLDIGVSSLRNLGKISKGKLVLWLLLGLSSVPLHLIYNSAVFSELSTYSYASHLVTEDKSQELYWTNMTNKFLGDDIQKIERLDKRACMSAYGKQLISDRGNLAVVITGNVSNFDVALSHSILDNGYNTGLQPFAWICNSTGFSSSCSINEALTRVDTWAIGEAQVHYCLSQRMPEQCRLQYSLYIMIAVMICNFVKAACMFLAVISSKEDPLVTVGDAVASFLNSEDPTTVGMCIVTKKEIKKGWRPAKTVPGELPPRMWKPHRAFWFSAASVSRWVLCNFLTIACISASLGLLIYSLKTWRDAKVPYNLRFFWEMGLGNADMRAVVYFSQFNNSNKDLISCILLANLPQTIFSFLYLLYNSIFTCMLLGEEWDRFSRQRRPLRVTSPTGAQRSTYFLHLPYRYSIPLIIGSSTMHWLISQSIFLVQIVEADQANSSWEIPYSIVGYSPISIIFGFILGTLMIVVAFIIGFRRYGDGIPLVGSCSAAISAACHPGLQKTPAAIVPVMWGVVSVDPDGHVGHCSFSGEEVSPPVLGQWYSGGSSGSD